MLGAATFGSLPAALVMHARSSTESSCAQHAWFNASGRQHMINGLTVAGLLDTGVQLKHHCNRPWAPERLVGSGLIEIARKPNRRPRTLSAARKARMASTFGPACRRTTNTGAGRRLLITEFKFG